MSCKIITETQSMMKVQLQLWTMIGTDVNTEVSVHLLVTRASPRTGSKLEGGSGNNAAPRPNLIVYRGWRRNLIIPSRPLDNTVTVIMHHSAPRTKHRTPAAGPCHDDEHF